MKCPFKKNVTFKRDEAGRIIGKSEKFGECDKDKCPFYACDSFYVVSEKQTLKFESCTMG
jgi:hypothetical protein